MESNPAYVQAYNAKIVIEYWWLIDSITCQTLQDAAEYPIDHAEDEEDEEEGVDVV